MLEKYYKYKLDYNDYIVFIKSGKFYEVIDRDSLIISKLFDYKLTKLSSTLKCGFPISNIERVKSILQEKEINYIIIDDQICDTYEATINHYQDYSVNIDIIKYNILKVERISKILNDLVCDENAPATLEKIEEILNEG